MIDQSSDVRCVVLSAEGRAFSAGLDLEEANFSGSGGGPKPPRKDAARKALEMARGMEDFQDSFTAIEKCGKPTIAAVHGACVGGGIDLITSCDIRFASQDAFFAVAEVQVGLAADVGTLQRLPKVVGNQSIVRDLCLTGRRFSSQEALDFGLLSPPLLQNKEECVKKAAEIAAQIAQHSPVAVIGTKKNLIYSRDHTVQEGLEYVKVWNSAMLQTEDLMKAGEAKMKKQTPKFSKL